jgi:hypothetical protein
LGVAKGPRDFSAFVESMAKYFTTFCFFLIIFLLTQFSWCAGFSKEQDDILSSAESLFKVMKEKNYPKIWFFLSRASKNSILDDAHKNIMKYEKEKGRETNFSKNQIEQDFLVGGLIA